MNVGIMRNNIKPTYLTELIAIYSRAYGINVLYIRPKDVDIKNKKVNAKILIKGEWIKIRTDIPKFIDISAFCLKPQNEKILECLRENTILSDNGLNKLKNKLKFIELLKKDPEYNYLIIPTKRVREIDDVESFLNKHKQIILKPSSGQYGTDIFFVDELSENMYQLRYETTNKKINKRDFINFYKKNIDNKGYIAQKYIQSSSKQGYPFDCRINMEKNIDGDWTVARQFIRIGIGQQVVSNISQGGAVSSLNSFLDANYDVGTVKKIKKSLKKISTTLPFKIEEMREQKLMTLGIDVGIDKDGTVYLFEVNSAPGTTQLRAQAAECRAGYYYFMKTQIEHSQGGGEK